MHRRVARLFYATAAAGIVLATAGFSGAEAPTAAAAPHLGPAVYTTAWAGYTDHGRWFRFVAATVTVPPRIVSKAHSGDMMMTLQHAQHGGAVHASIIVTPGGGPGSVIYDALTAAGAFRLSPKVGDVLRVGIYYDQHGHVYLTARDVTQGITRTVRAKAVNVVYNRAWLVGVVLGTVKSPATDTRLWKVSDTRLTTYTGQHGTVTGPWATSKVIKTTDGTRSGDVVMSPSGLWDHGQNFGVWLRHR